MNSKKYLIFLQKKKRCVSETQSFMYGELSHDTLGDIWIKSSTCCTEMALFHSRNKMQKLDPYTEVSGTRLSNYLDVITRLFVRDSLTRRVE